MNYSLPLKYFLVMTVMLLFTGMWLFVLHTSLSVDGILDYYAPKTLFGLLETVSPHLFAMGLVVFILTHFFAIVTSAKQEKFRLFSILFFLIMLLANVSGFFITETGSFFAILKLLSTLLFIGYSLVAIWKVWRLT